MSDFDVGHVLYASADPLTGAVTVHLGNAATGESYDNDATVWQSWGWLSLPAIPDAGEEGAEAYFRVTGDANQVLGGRDVRSAAIAGLIKQGESCAYASGSQACTLYKLDGSIVQFTTTDNTVTGRSVCQWVTPTGFRQEWPWGRTRLDNSGFHVQHIAGTKVCRFDVGSIAAPAPLDSFSTYFTIQGEMGRVNSSFVTVGPDGAVYSPVARADATIFSLNAAAAALSAAASAIAAFELALAKLGTIGVNAAAADLIAACSLPAGAAVSAIGTAQAAITAAAVGTVPAPLPIGSSSLAAS